MVGELPEGVLQVLIVGAEEPRGLQADIGMDLPDPLRVDDIVRVQPSPEQALEVPFLPASGGPPGRHRSGTRPSPDGPMGEELLDVAVEEGVE